MTQTLPDPLVAADIDLRGYEFMPLYGDRLKKSETWVMANPEGKVAALALWWHAYGHEVPAGTLPDNDTLLADYAGYGVALKSWLKIKPQAMRGWVKCSDGRLHHAFVARLVTEAWQFKKAQRDRTEKARLARLSQNQSQKKNDNVTGSVTKPVTASTGQDRTGHNKNQSSGGVESPTSANGEAPPPAPEKDLKPAEKREVTEGPAFDLAQHLRTLGVEIAPEDPRLDGWIAKGMTLATGDDAAAKARTRKGRAEGPIPVNLIALIIDDLLTPASKAAGNWWGTEDGIIAKAKEVGVTPNAGEDWEQLKARIHAAIRKAA